MDDDRTGVKKGGEIFNGNPSTTVAIVMCHACDTENDESVKGFASKASHFDELFLLFDNFSMLGVALRRGLPMFSRFTGPQEGCKRVHVSIPPDVAFRQYHSLLLGVPRQLIRA